MMCIHALSTDTHTSTRSTHVPGSRAVAVQNIEILTGQQLTAIHSRLNGAQTAQDANLLDVAHQWHNIQPLQLRINRVQSSNQMLKEQLESLRKTQHCVARYYESGHLLATIVDQLALVGRGIRCRYWWRTIVGAWRNMMMGSGHQFQGIGMVHHLQ